MERDNQGWMGVVAHPFNLIANNAIRGRGWQISVYTERPCFENPPHPHTQRKQMLISGFHLLVYLNTRMCKHVKQAEWLGHLSSKFFPN